MRKISLSLLIFTMCLTSVKSQLRVDSTGYVGVGITDQVIAYELDSVVHSPFNVCTVGIPEAIANFQSTDRQYAITAYTVRENQYDGTGIWSISQTKHGESEAVIGIGMSDDYYNASNNVIGIRGATSGGYNAVGVYGGQFAYTGSYYNFAGIYGTTNSTYPYFQRAGKYAGYFNGKVYVSDTLFVQNIHIPSASSSGVNKIINTSLNPIGVYERVSDKLRNVSSFELQHNEQVELTKQSNQVDEFLKGRTPQELSLEELHQLDSISMNMPPMEANPLASVNYGLDAEQLKDMFPKLVQQDKEGNYSINYIEMIPLLVKSIHELSEELEELKGTSKNRAKAQSETTNIEETVSDVDMVRMDQNKPNPFSESTVIGLNIPEKTQKANIFIYDLSGKQVQNVQVNERGETNITVYASELGAGMYIYTLVIDGKVVVTRRMIVEK